MFWTCSFWVIDFQNLKNNMIFTVGIMKYINIIFLKIIWLRELKLVSFYSVFNGLWFDIQHGYFQSNVFFKSQKTLFGKSIIRHLLFFWKIIYFVHTNCLLVCQILKWDAIGFLYKNVFELFEKTYFSFYYILYF